MNISDLPQCVVVDAFGTIAHLSQPTRPYARLRQILGSYGCDTTQFAHQAMTRPTTLGGLAELYGVDLAMPQAAMLEEMLMNDLAGMRLAPGVAPSLLLLEAHSIRVVIGSNLASPYGMMLRQLLRAQGVEVGDCPSTGRIGAAFSYDVGCVKPDTRFYASIQSELNLPGPAFLMVGDKQVEDAEGPVAAGWFAASPKIRSAEGLLGVWPDMVRSILAGAVE